MKKVSISLFAAAAMALSSCGGSGSLGGANEFATRTVSTQSVELETSYPASIKGVQDVEIRPKVSGFITEIRVSEGQAVSRGQVLFVIDNVTYEAAVRQTEAAVNSAEAQLATSKLTYENNQKLFDNNVIGTYELQSSRNAYEAAEAALAQAKANYVSAKENLSFCYVTSPADGVVGTLPYKVGALVSSSSDEPLTTISDINTMEVYFSMTEKEMLEMVRTSGGTDVANFPSVRLKLADGSVYGHEGHVAAISGVIDASTGSVLVRANFPNPERLLKSGGSGSILIPHSNDAAIVVPQDAVAQVQDKHFVYIVDKDNKVKYSAISVDPNDDGVNYIVTEGLKVGDVYVVNGITSLTDGMEITPLSEAEYQKALERAAEMGKDQDDLSKLKKDFSN